MKILHIAITAALMAVPALAFAPGAAQARNTSSDGSSCASGLARMIDHAPPMNMSVIATAKSARLSSVNNCALANVMASLAAKGGTYVRPQIQSNPDLLKELQSRGYTSADIVGASYDNGLVTIYVKAPFDFN